MLTETPLLALSLYMLYLYLYLYLYLLHCIYKQCLVNRHPFTRLVSLYVAWGKMKDPVNGNTADVF